MESIFRYLVVISAALTILFWGMPYIDYMWFSIEQIHLLDQSGLGTVIPVSDVLYWGILFIWLVLSVGLFFYNPLARTGFIVFYILSFVFGLLGGIQVVTPYESAIASLIGLADGAIITLAYLTSVGAKFESCS